MRTSVGTPPQNGWLLTLEPAVGKIKAEQPHHLLTERLLRWDRERGLAG